MELKFVLEKEIYKKEYLEDFKIINKQNIIGLIAIFMILLVDLVITVRYLLNNTNTKNLGRTVYITIFIYLVLLFLYSLIEFKVNKKYELMLLFKEYDLLEGKLEYTIKIGENTLTVISNGRQHDFTYRNIKTSYLKEKYIAIRTNENRLILLPQEAFENHDVMKNTYEEIARKAKEDKGKKSLSIDYTQEETKAIYKISNKDFYEIAYVKSLTDVDLKVTKEIVKYYSLVLLLGDLAIALTIYKLLGKWFGLGFFMSLLAVAGSYIYKISPRNVTRVKAKEYKKENMERERAVILKEDYLEIKSFNSSQRYYYDFINGIYEINGILWLAKDNKPLDYIILNSFSSEQKKEKFINELREKVTQKNNNEFLALQKKKSKKSKVIYTVWVMVFWILCTLFISIGAKEEVYKDISTSSVSIYELQNAVKEQIDFKEIIDEKNKEYFAKSFDYLDSFSLENIERQSNNEIAADIKVKIIYENAYEYCTSKVIFNYQDGKWKIADINKFDNTELHPLEGAGTVFISMLKEQVYDKGAFVYEGEKYDFSPEYLGKLKVISSKNIDDNVQVGLGIDGDDMYVIMNFDERNLEWNLISFELVRAR